MVSQAEVAAHLLLSDRRLRDLAKLPGAPVPQGRGDWELDAWRHFIFVISGAIDATQLVMTNRKRGQFSRKIASSG